jgi:hypothetical protein
MTRSKVILQVLEGADFHGPLRLLRFGSHVREEGDVAEFHQFRIDVGFIWVDVQSSSVQLKQYAQYLSTLCR